MVLVGTGPVGALPMLRRPSRVSTALSWRLQAFLKFPKHCKRKLKAAASLFGERGKGVQVVAEPISK